MGIIRCLLALSVLIAHSGSIFGFKLVGSQVAVQSFFIISGFYMSLILHEKYTGANGSYRLFITNRLLRIFPLYWLVLGLILVLSLAKFFYSGDIHYTYLGIYFNYGDSMDIASLGLVIFANLFIFLQDLVMFLGVNIQTGHLFFTPDFQTTDPALYRFLFIPQAWTLALELMFYAIAPFILKKSLKFIIVLIIFSLLIRSILFMMGYNQDPWTYRFFPSEILFFLLGNISYRIFKKIRDQKIDRLYLKLIYAFILCFVLFYSFINFPGLIYIYYTCFFIALPFVFLYSQKWKTDAYIGELSYPVYISHLFIFSVISFLRLPVPFGAGLNIMLATLLFSFIVNELVAKRIERYRQKRLV
jgi:peptidoglycan/LPS O-acetylase OafA/YrhL